jgi:hypothetical protein
VTRNMPVRYLGRRDYALSMRRNRTGGGGDAGWGVRVGEQQEGDMQLKELTVWWQQRRLAREGRVAFDSAATRELYEALDEASMLGPRR